MDVLANSFTQMLLEGIEIPRNPRALVTALESPQKLFPNPLEP